MAHVVTPQIEVVPHPELPQGDYEAPGQSRALSRALWELGVWHNLDLWGHDMRHDWPTWRRMMPVYLEHAF